MDFDLTSNQHQLRSEVRRLAEMVIAPRAAVVDRSEAYAGTMPRRCATPG